MDSPFLRYLAIGRSLQRFALLDRTRWQLHAGGRVLKHEEVVAAVIATACDETGHLLNRLHHT